MRALFSARGNRVVTFGGSSGTRVWATSSGRLVATLPAAETAAISRDGGFVATIELGGATTLWSAESGARVADLTRPTQTVAFSRDGRLVAAVGPDGAAGVWRSATGRQVAAFPGFGSLDAGFPGATFSEFSPGAAFSDDGRLLALGQADGTVRVWEVRTRQQVGAVGAGWVNALAFAPRGGLLAALAWNGELVGARSPASIAIRTGFRPNTCEPDFDPLLSADGTRLLARARVGAGLWTIEGRRVAGLTPPARPAAIGPNVGSAALNADGTIAAAAGAPNGCFRYAKEAYTTGAWTVSPPALRRTLPSDGRVLLDLAGRLIVANGALWPATGGPRVDDLGTVRTLSPDGKRVLVDRNGRLEIAATASGMTVAPLEDADALREELDLDPTTASFSPDGSRLLTPWGTRARLWDATSGEPIALLGRPGEEIESATFGGDGRLVLAVFPNRAAVLSALDGELLSGVAGSFARGALSANGAFAAVPRTDGALDVVELETGTRTTLGTDTGLGLTSALFGPASDLIVTRDEAGDVHVVRCAICASDDELLALARAQLRVVSRIEAAPPPVIATG